MRRQGFSPVVLLVIIAAAGLIAVIWYGDKQLSAPPISDSQIIVPRDRESALTATSAVSVAENSGPGTAAQKPKTATAPLPRDTENKTKLGEPVLPIPNSTGSPAYTLVTYRGEVFGAKVPSDWNTTSNQSGIEIADSNDSNTGASGVVAVGWFGFQTPDGFINLLLESIGATDIRTESESATETISDPFTNLTWEMKTRTFTFQKAGVHLKAKASVGIVNGYGQYIALLTAFQTTPVKWGQWAPTLERIATSITIINPATAGGAHTVRLPSAADLANDSSPLMDSWEYRNKVQERTSHEFSDAIMGQETDLVSPSTGRTYTLPLNAYDPTKGGYRNPEKWEEILADPYQK